MSFSSFDEAIFGAKNLDADKNWVALADYSQKIVEQFPDKAEGWLLLALAKHRLGEHNDAIQNVRQGLDKSPESNWGLNLAVAIYRLLQRHSECLDLLLRLVSLPSADAENYETAAEYFAEVGNWDEAAKYSNLRRDRFIATRRADPTFAGREGLTLVVQAFARVDRICELLDSLNLAKGRKACNLVICIDNAINSKNQKKYAGPNKEVISSVSARMPILLESYNSVTLSINPVNLGTALTAQRACDLGFALTDNVVFFEEDCIVAVGMLSWFKFGLDQIRKNDSYWFVGGESPFFDSKGKTVPSDIYAAAQKIAKVDKVRKSYVEENYVPSTCFATTIDIWKKVRKVRGLPRGAEHISTFLGENNKKTIFPSVPFVKDVGMQDELGYSVAKLGKAGVQEAKTVYLLNDTVEGSFDMADFNAPALYSATSNLEMSFFKELGISVES